MSAFVICFLLTLGIFTCSATSLVSYRRDSVQVPQIHFQIYKHFWPVFSMYACECYTCMNDIHAVTQMSKCCSWCARYWVTSPSLLNLLSQTVFHVFS